MFRGRRRIVILSTILTCVVIYILTYVILSERLARISARVELTFQQHQLGSAAADDVRLAGEYDEKTLQMLALTDAVSMPKAQTDHSRTNSSSRANAYVPKSILVHLDLKGAAPKLSYLTELFPLLRHLGATGVLIEYEDMLPYWGPLTPLSATNAYRYSDIGAIVRLARQHRLEVIPLVQTFGHMEFGLKLAEFKHLREVRAYPQSICPTRNGSISTIRMMIDQVVALHPGITRLHIGCDEVSHIGWCGECTARAARVNGNYASSNNYLFLHHVRDVAEYVKSKHGVQPIIWDDMLRNIPSADIIRSGLSGGLVEPMVWVYSTNIYLHVSPSIWRKYGDLFPSIWAAGAFKGASGESAYIPDAYNHVMNTAEWIAVMRKESAKFRGLAGFVLTGWQRYDHFAVLCELLAPSVPSLAITLLALSNGFVNDDVLKNASVVLACNERTLAPTMDTLAQDPFLWRLVTCSFPGHHAFRVMRTLYNVKPLVVKHVQQVVHQEGWLTFYNFRHNFSSPWRIRVSRQRGAAILRTVRALKKHASAALNRYYEDVTVKEWVEQQVEPLLSALEFLDRKSRELTQRDTWPRRPLL